MCLLHESFAWLVRFSHRHFGLTSDSTWIDWVTVVQLDSRWKGHLRRAERACRAYHQANAHTVIWQMWIQHSFRHFGVEPFAAEPEAPQAVGRVNFVIKRSHPNEHWPCTRFRCTTTKPLSSITQQMARARTVADYIIAEPDFAPIFDILQNVFAAFVQYFQRWRMTSWRLSMRVTVNLRERCGSLAGCRPKHAYLPPAPLGPISLLRNHRQQP